MTIFRYWVLADQARTILPIVGYLLAEAVIVPLLWKHAAVILVWPQAYFHSFAKRRSCTLTCKLLIACSNILCLP